MTKPRLLFTFKLLKYKRVVVGCYLIQRHKSHSCSVLLTGVDIIITYYAPKILDWLSEWRQWDVIRTLYYARVYNTEKETVCKQIRQGNGCGWATRLLNMVLCNRAFSATAGLHVWCISFLLFSILMQLVGHVMCNVSFKVLLSGLCTDWLIYDFMCQNTTQTVIKCC